MPHLLQIPANAPKWTTTQAPHHHPSRASFRRTRNQLHTLHYRNNNNNNTGTRTNLVSSPGYSSSHGLSPPLPHGSSLHTPASFPSPTGGSAGGGPTLHLLQTAAAVAGYGSSPRHHPPRITQPHHFGLSAEDLFASVFGGPAGSSSNNSSGGVGLDPEFDFLSATADVRLAAVWATDDARGGDAGSGQQQQQTSTTASHRKCGPLQEEEEAATRLRPRLGSTFCPALLTHPVARGWVSIPVEGMGLVVVVAAVAAAARRGDESAHGPGGRSG
jgi:hypothetical protein